MMFGPMLLRQFQKFQRQKSKQQEFPEDNLQQEYREEVDPNTRNNREDAGPTNRKYKKDEFV